MGLTSTEEIEYDQTKAHNNNNNNSDEDSWSSTTNWTISHGSLEDSITFESSDSPIDSESTTHMLSPLILHRPLPDSSPCEIKLCFMQKHEIRQVYVRSTARVYEIYYAPTLQSENEYLCTVRCSIAEREGEFLQANGIIVVSPQYLKDYVGKPTEGGVTAEAKLCTSEDDWVEIKVPDGNRVSCLQKHTTGNEQKSIEDLCEATAQISDADPCMSLTIRFLSLPNKGSICIDEVYIFGDPISSNEMETPAAPMENQASSFMAMLVPTLLQLSKSGISQKQQDKDVLDSQRKENEVGIAERTSDFADAKKENEQEKRMSAELIVQLDVTDKPEAEPAHSQPLTHQNLSRENHNISTTSNEASEGRIVGAIEQLLDRVSRIENICLRFEEKMVSPMNSMEMRLQRLEQQVEILAKNSQYSGVASCTRITAPSFTCSESNSSSLYNDGSEYQACGGASELGKKDLPCKKLSEPSDDVPVSSNSSPVLPNLVIAAPEFSCGEDEEENEIVESVKVSSQKMQKQVLSIDDALAAALSGFLSTSRVLPQDDETLEVIASGSISDGVNEKSEFSQSAQSVAHDCTLEGNDNVRPSTYTQILAVTAPDFTEDDEFENGNFIIASSATAPDLASEVNASNEIASPSTGSRDPRGLIDLNRSKSMDNATSTVAPETYAEEERFLHEIVHLQETSGVIGSKDHLNAQENICRSQDDPTTCPSGQDDKVAETNVSDSTNEPQMNSHNLGNAAESEEHDASRGSHVDIMQNVCEYLRPAALDFDIPILDVKFTANEDSSIKLSIEDLLRDTSDVNVEASCVDESADNASTSEGTTFTVMDGDGNPLVDFGVYAADTFTNLDGHGNQSKSSHQDVFIGLI